MSFGTGGAGKDGGVTGTGGGETGGGETGGAGTKDAGPKDAGPKDGGPKDGGPDDGGPKDAGDAGDGGDASGCTSDADCATSASGPVCDTATGQCGLCSTANDTCPTGQYCASASLTCIPGCKTDADCATAGSGDGGATLTCDTTLHECKGCAQDGDCPLGTLCNAGLCAPGCTATHGCPTNDQCCGGQCADLQNDPAHCGNCITQCASGTLCQQGSCGIPCPQGKADCNKNPSDGCEVSTDTDPNNCGGCGVVCDGANITTPTCTAGVCGGACAPGFADCNGDKQKDGCETSIDVDPNDCGACGTTCSTQNITTPTCGAGVCDGTCDMGFADCNGDKLTDGCEVNLSNDPANCGACGTACSNNNVVTPQCTGAVCTSPCGGEFLDCDGNKQTNGCEVNPETDPSNCGGCGKACSSNHVTPACAGGACDGACAPGYSDCNGDKRNDGCETATGSDPSNCGGCGLACSSNHVTSLSCAAGTCNGACAPGWFDCDGNKQTNGCETTILADPNNCGGCGVICSTAGIASATCVGGVCSGACAPGYADCDGNKQTDGCEVHIAVDPNNCGGCGVVCSTNHVSAACANGVCDGACAPGYADCDNNKLTNGCEVAVDTDTSNCGGCGVKCSSFGLQNVACGGGVCDGACAPGYADCDGNKQTNGCETQISGDVNNCGGCGIKCSTNGMANVACTNGVCTGTCLPGYVDCDGNKQTNGCEAQIGTDPNNCGNCGTVCSTNHVAAACTNGQCSGACQAGYADCDGNKQLNGCETDIAIDPTNCGTCGKTCSSNNMATVTCASGVCNGTCAAGFGDCDANKQTNGCETSVTSSINNCGGCGVVCSSFGMSNVSCSGGVCNGTCSAGFADCDGNKQANGCEANLASDPNNCSACGVSCSSTNVATRTCTSGVCSGTCIAGYADCDNNKLTDGCETGTFGDPNNCGGCGIKCSTSNIATPTCGNGVCNGMCVAGYADCDGNKQSDGCETPVSTDPNNCGGCKVVCSSFGMTNVTCSGGACNGTCAAGFADCDNNKQTNGCESNIATSPATCGGCGLACSGANMATVSCTAGVCSGTCQSGFADCDGNKLSNGCEVNTNTDAKNCGGCGNVCPAGDSCVNGSCVTCNTAVLVLSDGQTAPDATITSALQTAGLVPTMIDSGATTYAGSPAATGFGAVLVLVGTSYGTDMPAAGQTAIVNAFNGGTGFVATEWASYAVANLGHWTTLRALLLATYTTNFSALATYTLTSAGHPIWAGLPTSFTTTVTISEASGTIINGGTRIATSSQGANGIIVKDVVGSSGRTVHIDHPANYDANWTSDPNLMKMFTNAARWAARCQ